MFKSFIISFKLKNTYRVNSIIYSLKQIPLIKKALPNTLYKSKGLKVLGNIISFLIEIVSIFIGKLLYILLMIFSMLELYKTGKADTFLHLFTFLTICGALMNTYMFNPTKDKYYAMILMNMDAKKYTLSNYYYSMLKVIVGFLPFTLIFGMMAGLPIWLCIVLPFFVVIAKMLVSCYCILDYKKHRVARNENLPTKLLWAAIGILLVIAYGLPYLGITINKTIFMIIFGISFIAGIYAFYQINKFEDYKQLYKELLVPNNINMVENQTSSQAARETSLKQIELDSNSTSNKNGFAYFHELFVKRHRKILTKAVKKQSIIILFILAAVLFITQINSDFKQRTNELILVFLPYFLFIMYILNRGTTVTQAMFMNCDHSMLTYRFYRTPKVILALFKERLKTLISINLLPASIIAIGLPLVLWVTGGTNNIYDYVVLFISIIAMSIFFSVHYLVMYYLLQPYNVNIEMKSSTYSIVQAITYFVCYYMLQLRMPIMTFGIASVAFSIIYCLISLILVYRLAPKTFKLRL